MTSTHRRLSSLRCMRATTPKGTKGKCDSRPSISYQRLPRIPSSTISDSADWTVYGTSSSVKTKLQCPTPSSRYSKMSAFKRIPKIIGKSMIEHVLHHELDRAGNSISLEDC